MPPSKKRSTPWWRPTSPKKRKAMSIQGLKLWTPAKYRIRVKGHLDSTCSDWLGGMSITTTGEGDEASVSTLVGLLLDQAALMGVLDALYNCYHCPLLSVEFLGSA
jgi:hypothetical protein